MINHDFETYLSYMNSCSFSGEGVGRVVLEKWSSQECILRVKVLTNLVYLPKDTFKNNLSSKPFTNHKDSFRLAMQTLILPNVHFVSKISASALGLNTENSFCLL